MRKVLKVDTFNLNEVVAALGVKAMNKGVELPSDAYLKASLSLQSAADVRRMVGLLEDIADLGAFTVNGVDLMPGIKFAISVIKGERIDNIGLDAEEEVE